MLEGKTFFFVGAGNICESMVKGLLSTGTVRPGDIRVSNRSNQERLNFLRNYYGIVPVDNKKSAAGEADVIILAMKPQDIYSALQELTGAVKENQLIISVLAGIPTSLIEDGLGLAVPVVRAMPNTSCAVLESATGLCAGRYTNQDQLGLAAEIFRKMGEVVILEETLLDAVTGLSGSGPAYIYYLVEALEKAGENAGIPRELARPLVLKTLVGAAKMLLETGEPPEVLRQQVTSPNGTTMAGINELNKGNFQGVIRRAVLRATQRSRELGRIIVEKQCAQQ
ncbi:pyrroline-5-carboxylate reductase [Desulforamulus hydrothermalis]|uniref:Pyrroline-5-carboxylate reductase n=1 Tax=Desulforamulus hydrothermalis Lam5 = DSM 18033 TaxID=1121428 RepID=K8EKF6_9FIRM|nr:pyrroline-5-carboxylate reductase [Desulforamulus hydrothermalis]CCO09036.1 Pyrroline-5-carboxylate reductase 1 [Desulforamulus hydrothermalis Lam5 = DSM 18033]SHG77519.1 pyrroline-5-carboxylate reductase [Desulforamulus hydrothermalis Lam5 = DSM 18033]